MQLRFRRDFDAPARVAWAYLCVPELMNQWSGAHISLKAPGEGGHAGGPGARRKVRVHAGGRELVLDEVIRDARPPHLLVYQVVNGFPLRSHLGKIHLDERDGGCSLRWDVDFDFVGPGTGRLVARVLRSQLERSLDALQTLLSRPNVGAAIELPTFSDVPGPTPEDWQRAEAVLAAQEAHAAELDARADAKRLFAHVYGDVSAGILRASREGRFTYPAWPLRLVPVFHDYYWRNYQRWCGTEKGAVESHWRRAFQVAENGSRRYPGADGQLLSGFVLSAHAHIESDLPRSLAEVYVDHFAEDCDYVRFRGDYFCMGQIFLDSSRKLQSLIPSEFIPLWAKTVRELMPEEFVQALIYRRSYDLPKERRAAFRRGAEIAEVLLRRRER